MTKSEHGEIVRGKYLYREFIKLGEPFTGFASICLLNFLFIFLISGIKNKTLSRNKILDAKKTVLLTVRKS